MIGYAVVDDARLLDFLLGVGWVNPDCTENGACEVDGSPSGSRFGEGQLEAGPGSHRSVHFSVRRAAPRLESLGRYSSQRNTTDGDERSTGPWYTASTFVPSGSRT